MIREFSAGGVVVRQIRGKWSVAVIEPARDGAVKSDKKSQPRRKRPIFALPKGIVDPGETPEQTAVREVQEETGVVAHPVAKLKDSTALQASDPKIITSVIGPTEIHLPVSTEHHLNWLESVKSRKPPIAPVEIAHRSCSACLLHHIAMKTKRKLYWDPAKERFKNDDEANAMLSRPQRSPYTISQT